MRSFHTLSVLPRIFLDCYFVIKLLFLIIKETFQNFSRKYDLSRGKSKLLEDLFRDMFTSLVSFSKIFSLRELCSAANVDVRKCFQIVLEQMLQETQESR